MCGYSKKADEKREAVQGERLVMSRFEHTCGFASPGAPNVAVCLRPGSKLMIRNLPFELQAAYRLGPEISALFFERMDPGNVGNPDLFTDWISFTGRREAMPLLNLPLGTTIDVLEVGEFSATDPDTGLPLDEIGTAPLPEPQTPEPVPALVTA